MCIYLSAYIDLFSVLDVADICLDDNHLLALSGAVFTKKRILNFAVVKASVLFSLITECIFHLRVMEIFSYILENTIYVRY